MGQKRSMFLWGGGWGWGLVVFSVWGGIACCTFLFLCVSYYDFGVDSPVDMAAGAFFRDV